LIGLTIQSPNLRQIKCEWPGTATLFRGYTSTSLAERELYNFPSNRDYSLRSRTNY
jgi:hypothetical protein